MKPQNTPALPPARLGALLALLCTLPAAHAADYSWNAGSLANWSAPSNWLVDGSAAAAAPGAGDNIIASTLLGGIDINIAHAQVNNWTAAANQNILSQGANALTINGTLTSSTGTLIFRHGGASGSLNLSVNAVSLTGGTLSLGEATATANRYLNSFSANTITVSGSTLAFRTGGETSGTATITGALTLGDAGIVQLRQMANNRTESGTLRVGSLVSSSATAKVQVYNQTAGRTGTGTLELNNADATTATYAGIIENGGSVHTLNVIKNGEGTQIFSGANTYTGTTEINVGSLFVNGTHTGGGAYTVASGGTLGGGGTATSTGFTVQNGGTLQGGDGTLGTTLTLNGALDFQDGSILQLALGAGGTHSSLARGSGTWSFDDNQAFSLLNLGAETGTYLNIITGLTGSETGLSSIGAWTVLNDGWQGTFSYSDGNVNLVLTAIPEPSAFALLAAGGVLLCAAMRRRGRA